MDLRLVPKLRLGTHFRETLFPESTEERTCSSGTGNGVSKLAFPNGVWERDSARSQTPFGNALPGNSVSRVHRRAHVFARHRKRSFQACVPKRSLGTR